MTCEGVPERVWRNPFGDGCACGGLFDGALNVGLVQVVASLLPQRRNEGEGRCREEPLPDELFGGVLVFLLKLPGQECASVASGDVLGMEAADEVHLFANFRQSAGREWNSTILLAFAVVDGQ